MNKRNPNWSYSSIFHSFFRDWNFSLLWLLSFALEHPNSSFLYTLPSFLCLWKTRIFLLPVERRFLGWGSPLPMFTPLPSFLNDLFFPSKEPDSFLPAFATLLWALIHSFYLSIYHSSFPYLYYSPSLLSLRRMPFPRLTNQPKEERLAESLFEKDRQN